MHKRGPRDRLIADLHAVVEDAEALLKATSAESGEKIEGLRTRIEQTLHQARERIAQAEAEARQQAHRAVDTAESYVQEKLGMLLNRH